MATFTSEMPSLPAAEVLADATTVTPSNSGGIDANTSGSADTSSASTVTPNYSTTSNTISAAADSSDNQSETPQPQGRITENQQEQQQTTTHHSYAPNHVYAAAANYSTGGSIYASSTSHMDLVSANHLGQQQQQHSNYSSSYLNSYEQFYQQQQQQQQQSDSYNNPSSSHLTYASNDYKQAGGIRFHPYLQTPISGGQITSASSDNNSNNNLNSSQPSVVATSAISPRVVSSTSPSSSSNAVILISGGANSIRSLSTGNSTSPSITTSTCKKCGLVCSSEPDLQEHITNMHGLSPYQSGSFASSPYVKEELQQQATSAKPINVSSTPTVQSGSGQTNPSDILDLDSQKMLYPPAPDAMQTVMQQHPTASRDPLQSMHNMQQRAGIAQWHQQNSEGLPAYIQSLPQPSNDKGLSSHHSTYYQNTKQSPYGSNSDIKSEFSQQPETQGYATDKSFDSNPTSATNNEKSIANHPTYYQAAKQSSYGGGSVIKNEYAQTNPAYVDDKSFDLSATRTQQILTPACGNAVIKTEYSPVIKTEYQSADTQSYMTDKSFDVALPSSPAEFPSTTTGGSQELQQPTSQQQQQQQQSAQQFRSGNFEPPSSSSVLPSNNLGAKASNWKSNEARRPKTYNCTACNKWFTSSGHLKRHYNTTLHKNAVKSSGLPDPATLPMSAHHHPARDHSGKISRGRGGNGAVTQQQQPPAPVQPPDPPNSPHDYGDGVRVSGAQTARSTHYAATPSPTNITQQSSNFGTQSYQHSQFLQQAQSTANVSIATSPFQQQQTPMNGHPNALAGLSVPTIQMPSSQMRGLLNARITVNNSVKKELMEVEAAMEERDQKPDVTRQEQAIIQRDPQMAVEVEHHNVCMVIHEEMQQSVTKLEQQQEPVEQAATVVDLNAGHHQAVISPVEDQQHTHATQVPEGFPTQQSLETVMDRHYLNTTSSNNNLQAHSPLTIFHQQYPEQLVQQEQLMEDNIFSHTRIMSPQQPQHNIMETQPYNIMRMAINHMQQQQQPDITIPTTNTGNMPANQRDHHTQLLPMDLQLLVSMPLPLDKVINTNIPQQLPHTTSNNNIIPSFQQLQQASSVQEPQLGPIRNYHHPIIGNNSLLNAIPTNTEIVHFEDYGDCHQQIVTTNDGQIFHLIQYAQAPHNSYVTQGSPQEGDLPPPSTVHCAQEKTSTFIVASPPEQVPISNNQVMLENDVNLNYENEENLRPAHGADANAVHGVSNAKTANKIPKSHNGKTRKKLTSPNKETVILNSTLLPNGRIKCLDCGKDFAKICYLTQHHKSSHFGEYPYRCHKCGKRYKLEEDFNEHIPRHNEGDKPHKCEQCPKQFHHKTDLRRHIEAIHTGFKKYICSVCEKSFCRKDHLRKHLKIHNRPRVIVKKSAKFAKVQ
uniref:C2H2-type domain-containing protein n=1 Tax=Glossina pallidipes TaxID=7398 RepID=A0A1B0AC05_GLOPL